MRVIIILSILLNFLFAKYFSIQLYTSKYLNDAKDFLNSLQDSIKKESFIYKTDRGYYTVRYLINKDKKKLYLVARSLNQPYIIVPDDYKKIKKIIKSQKQIPKESSKKVSKSNKSENGLLSIGIIYSKKVPKSAFNKFQWLVINHNVKTYKGRAKLIAYISIGEQINPVNKKWIIGKNPLWNSYIMDIRNKGYQDYLLAQLDKMKNFQGFFFDTLDSYLITNTDKTSYKKGLIEFFKKVKKRFPNKILIFNRGYEILQYVKPTAVVTENLIMLNGKRLSKKDQEWLVSKLEMAKNLGVIPIVVEYVKPWNYKKAIQRAKEILEFGYIPYVSDIYLKKVGVSSGDVKLENNKYIFYVAKKHNTTALKKIDTTKIPNWLKMEIELKKYNLPKIRDLLHKKGIAPWQKVAAYYKLFEYRKAQQEIFQLKNIKQNMYETYLELFKKTGNYVYFKLDKQNDLFFNRLEVKNFNYYYTLNTVSMHYKEFLVSKKSRKFEFMMGVSDVKKLLSLIRYNFYSNDFKGNIYLYLNEYDLDHKSLIKSGENIVGNSIGANLYYSRARNSYSFEGKYSINRYESKFKRVFMQVAFSRMFHANSFYTIYVKRLVYDKFFTSSNEIGGNIFLGELHNRKKKAKYYFNPSIFYNTKSHFGFNIIVGMNKRVIKADNLNIMLGYSPKLKEIKLEYKYFY